MKIWKLATSCTLCFLYAQIGLLANSSEDSFFVKSIAQESLSIQHTSPEDYTSLSDLYASRGEDYLILGKDQQALEDFQLSYEYALNCGQQESRLLFRPLFGAFMVHLRSENLESAQEIYPYLERILKNAGCDNTQHTASHSPLYRKDSDGTIMPISHKDWPILGPDRIPTKDCLERVNNTVKALSILIATIKRPEVSALAIAMINQLADTASNCCRAGGIWKGCLQKLINKLHYWKAFGIPADPTWD